MSRGPLVLTPLRVEAHAVRRGTGAGTDVIVTGMGAERSRRAAADLTGRAAEAPAVAVAGFGAGLDAELSPGHVVVASEVRGDGAAIPLPGAHLLAAAMRRERLAVTVGPIVTTDRIVRGERRDALAATGAVAVDMESAWLLEAVNAVPRAVVRVVVDTPDHELPSRWTLRDGVRAYRALHRVAGVLEEWGHAAAARDVLLAGPRSFCAGVDRAIDIVERGLERFGAPVYVRRQIVHNRHVVDELTGRGAVFVDELDEVPDEATVVFSAHGVPPSVREEADRRGLHVIDATCPLVAKVHSEIRRFTRQGHGVVLIGHRGHDETEGTLGEADGIQLVTTPDDVDAVEVDDPGRVAYVTQTTLATDDVQGVVERLEQRFPAIVGPAADDICYATQNRQDAVRAIASDCDLLLVVGSRNSSNSNRLAEVAARHGCRSELIDDETELRLDWLAGAHTIGLTAGASAPEDIVQRVIETLGVLGPVNVAERSVIAETTQFALPSEVR